MDLLTHPTFLQSSQILHTTLDVKDLIKYFYQALHTLVSYEHLSYYHPDIMLSIQLGTASSFQHEKTIILNNQILLGEMILSRSSPFTSSDVHMIDKATSFLLHPLHNALRYQEALKHAQLDPLTQLGNRRTFNTAFSQEMDFATRHQLPLSLLILDIDYFKQINDQKGHAAGDATLSHISKLINQVKRKYDLAFRYGGDEFILLLKNTSQAGAICIAERLRVKIQNALTVSIGVATSQPLETADKLFARADKALYFAKKHGRNQVACSF